MNTHGIRSQPLTYKDYANLVDGDKVQASTIRKITKTNHSRVRFEILPLPESPRDVFKDSRAILLSQAGALKDDDTLDELLEHIYRERGRSETE